MLKTMLSEHTILIDRSMCTNGSTLIVCEPLLIAPNVGIKQTFADVFTDKETKLAVALSHKYLCYVSSINWMPTSHSYSV